MQTVDHENLKANERVFDLTLHPSPIYSFARDLYNLIFFASYKFRERPSGRESVYYISVARCYDADNFVDARVLILIQA